MTLDWPRIIVWLVSREIDGASSASVWFPLITGLIGVLGTFSGVAIGGVVSYLIKQTELSHQITQENRKLKIRRLEQLHKRTLDFPTLAAQVVIGYMHLRSSGSMSRKELGDVLSPTGFASSKINSLLRIYASELVPDLDQLNESFSALVMKCAEYLSDTTVQPDSLTSLQAVVAQKCSGLAGKIQTKLEKEISS